jgi:hypothetical protein
MTEFITVDWSSLMKVRLRMKESIHRNCRSSKWPEQSILLRQRKKPCITRALLDKLRATHIVKKFPSFYGTRRFITVFTRARKWSLSWTRCIQSTLFYPISLRFTYLPIYAYVFRVVSSLMVFRSKFCISHLSYACYMDNLYNIEHSTWIRKWSTVPCISNAVLLRTKGMTTDYFFENIDFHKLWEDTDFSPRRNGFGNLSMCLTKYLDMKTSCAYLSITPWRCTGECRYSSTHL